MVPRRRLFDLVVDPDEEPRDSRASVPDDDGDGDDDGGGCQFPVEGHTRSPLSRELRSSFGLLNLSFVVSLSLSLSLSLSFSLVTVERWNLADGDVNPLLSYL